MSGYEHLLDPQMRALLQTPAGDAMRRQLDAMDPSELARLDDGRPRQTRDVDLFRGAQRRKAGLGDGDDGLRETGSQIVATYEITDGQEREVPIRGEGTPAVLYINPSRAHVTIDKGSGRTTVVLGGRITRQSDPFRVGTRRYRLAHYHNADNAASDIVRRVVARTVADHLDGRSIPAPPVT